MTPIWGSQSLSSFLYAFGINTPLNLATVLSIFFVPLLALVYFSQCYCHHILIYSTVCFISLVRRLRPCAIITIFDIYIKLRLLCFHTLSVYCASFLSFIRINPWFLVILCLAAFGRHSSCCFWILFLYFFSLWIFCSFVGAPLNDDDISLNSRLWNLLLHINAICWPLLVEPLCTLGSWWNIWSNSVGVSCT